MSTDRRQTTTTWWQYPSFCRGVKSKNFIKRYFISACGTYTARNQSPQSFCIFLEQGIDAYWSGPYWANSTVTVHSKASVVTDATFVCPYRSTHSNPCVCFGLRFNFNQQLRAWDPSFIFFLTSHTRFILTLMTSDEDLCDKVNDSGCWLIQVEFGEQMTHVLHRASWFLSNEPEHPGFRRTSISGCVPSSVMGLSCKGVHSTISDRSRGVVTTEKYFSCVVR